MERKRNPIRRKRERVLSGTALNKYLSTAGICSRRQAVERIKTGKVYVNGRVIKEPGYRVQPADVVECNYEVVKATDSRVYILVNKPTDHVTTVSDERGRRTVMDLVGEQIDVRLYPVGRLDRGTTGLLILTNDGELTQKLSHPRYEIEKVYQAVLDRPLTFDDLKAIENGLELRDGFLKVDAVLFVPGKRRNHIQVTLHSGKNRIVRRIFEHLGYKVVQLDRVGYAGLTKRGLPLGKWRKLSAQEVTMLSTAGSVKADIRPERSGRARRPGVARPKKQEKRYGRKSNR